MNVDQGDNCVRENKNAFVLAYLSLLVQRFKVRVAALAFLRKSHTHNGLGRAEVSFVRAPSSDGSLSQSFNSLDTLPSR